MSDVVVVSVTFVVSYSAIIAYAVYLHVQSRRTAEDPGQ